MDFQKKKGKKEEEEVEKVVWRRERKRKRDLSSTVGFKGKRRWEKIHLEAR